VPALALTPDGKRWLAGTSDFLMHVKPLAQLFLAKCRAALRQTAWASQVDACVWAKSWVVDCRPVGSGTSALKYLAPYIFRIALSNNRIEEVANEAVTFRYIEGKTGAQKRATLPLATFIGRFLAHVLPKGFVKVRYYGLLAIGKRKLLSEVRSILALRQAVAPPPRTAAAPEPLVVPSEADVRRCPSCGQPMRLVQTLPPKRQHERLVTTMVGAPSSRGPPHPAEEHLHLKPNLPGSLGAPGRWCASQPRSAWPLARLYLWVARSGQEVDARSQVLPLDLRPRVIVKASGRVSAELTRGGAGAIPIRAGRERSVQRGLMGRLRAP